MKWETVIGLEVHVQLNTRAKIFSGSRAAFGAAPNVAADVVDLAFPGSLPVVNREVVMKALKLGLALDAKINRLNFFDRKNYFYPDLPKAYQITQLTHPIIAQGGLAIMLPPGEKTIRINNAHMEENAGKSIHDLFPDATAIDLNRAGTPLIEIVSEPDMRSAEEAVLYLKTLHALVTWLDICDGDMSQGLFRADVNVSVRPEGEEKFGTRTEIKNLNSFRHIEEAINYEAARQIELLEDGGEIHQETRLFDAREGVTRSMRSKEDAHDYRYFPDPDLLPVEITETMLKEAKDALPELPRHRRERFINDYELSAYDAFLVTATRPTADFFEAVAEASGEPKLAANWLGGELTAMLNKNNLDFTENPISAERLAHLIQRIVDGTLSGKLAKQVFDTLWREPLSVDEIIARDGLKQINDEGELTRMIAEVLAQNPKSIEQYRAGKTKALNALVGQVMKMSRGKANPAQVQNLIKDQLA